VSSDELDVHGTGRMLKIAMRNSYVARQCTVRSMVCIISHELFAQLYITGRLSVTYPRAPACLVRLVE